MSRIFNDPTLAKAAVLLLGGMVIVLLIAVVVLALKKYQVYYIDDEEIDQELKEKEKNKLNLKLPKVKKPEKKAKEVKETEEPEEEPVKEAEEVKPVETVKPAETVIQEPEDLIRADASKPQEKTDTTFIPEMNNVPPVNHTVPRAKEPGQKLYGVRITITVGAQRTTADVTDFPCLIGREADKCDVIISEPAVSRRHARLLKEDDQLLIEDVSEHNGTYLNEMKIPPLGKVRIHEGDTITLGRAHIRIDFCLYQ